jgi:CheY-like chemotaxis protein
MNFQDLDEARALHGALMDTFVAHTGGRNDPDALSRIEQLCDAGTAALDDPECRIALRNVKAYSKLLFSEEGLADLDAGSLSAADYLRLRIYNALSALRGRLGNIEAERLLRRRAEPDLRLRRDLEPPALTGDTDYKHSGQRLRVLVVEDNRDSAETLRQLLYHSGYEVAVAFTGQDGLRAAKRMNPHVVLCDIGLPDTNGFVVASTLRREAGPGLRLIAVTAYGQEEDRRRALDAGFDLHLVKPVDPVVLLKRLES